MGEAGRGFSGVADEVRSLAQKTMAATTDIAAIVNCWSQPSSCDLCADLDGSGAVNAADLATLLAAWGFMCP